MDDIITAGEFLEIVTHEVHTTQPTKQEHDLVEQFINSIYTINMEDSLLYKILDAYHTYSMDAE
jgi:hypothetical protein